MSRNYNLIYVFASGLNYKSLGYAGNTAAHTPVCDRFSSENTNLINACSGHPLGSPYRASLFTGKYSVSTMMVMDNLRMKPCKDNFANILSGNGYKVDFIGKWHLYSNQIGNETNVRNSYVPEGNYRLGFNGYFAAYDNHFRYYAPDAYYHLDSPYKMFIKGFEPDHQTELAEERIKLHSENKEPFALFLSYGTPHAYWDKENVPEEYYRLFEKTEFGLPENSEKKGDPHADYLSMLSPKDIPLLGEQMKCYYAMIANLDRNLGKILGTVKNCGIENDTIIVFTSDHGEMFGEHGRKGKNIFYDEAVRVPFIISGREIKKGVNKTPFNTVDIMPTLLSLMGIDNTAKTEGKDISGVLKDGTFIKNPCLLTGMGPGDVWGNNREWRAVRDDRYTYAVYLSDGSEYLFDNFDDPLQKNNLSENEDFREIKLMLKASMYQKMAEINDSFKKNSYYKHKKVKDRKIL